MLSYDFPEAEDLGRPQPQMKCSGVDRSACAAFDHRGPYAVLRQKNSGGQADAAASDNED